MTQQTTPTPLTVGSLAVATIYTNIEHTKSVTRACRVMRLAGTTHYNVRIVGLDSSDPYFGMVMPLPIEQVTADTYTAVQPHPDALVLMAG